MVDAELPALTPTLEALAEQLCTLRSADDLDAAAQLLLEHADARLHLPEAVQQAVRHSSRLLHERNPGHFARSPHPTEAFEATFAQVRRQALLERHPSGRGGCAALAGARRSRLLAGTLSPDLDFDALEAQLEAAVQAGDAGAVLRLTSAPQGYLRMVFEHRYRLKLPSTHKAALARIQAALEPQPRHTVDAGAVPGGDAKKPLLGPP